MQDMQRMAMEKAATELDPVKKIDFIVLFDKINDMPWLTEEIIKGMFSPDLAAQCIKMMTAELSNIPLKE
jgi:hypothetical protein